MARRSQVILAFVLASIAVFVDLRHEAAAQSTPTGPWASGWSRMTAAVTLKPIENDPSRGALGIRVGGSARAVSLLLPQAQGGAYVVSVVDGAAATGLIQRGDVVSAINGRSVIDYRHLVQLVSAHSGGTTLQVEFWRMAGGVEGVVAALYQAAQSDDANATFLLGYLEGFDGGDGDLKRVFGFYHRAAALGSVDAMEATADAYRNGVGIESSLPEAAQWYRQAIERGSAPAMYGLASLLATGKIGEVNPVEVFELMRRSAQGGHALAHYFVASYHDAGYGTARNPQTGAWHLIEAVRLGGPDVLGRFDSEQTWKRSVEFYLALQRRLLEIKAYRGPIDGKLGPALNIALQQLAQTPQ